MKLKIWFLEFRPQFLILSVVLGILGTSIAWYDGAFNFGYAALAMLGTLLAHISVNLLNDYYDYKSGVDLVTERTPFSGGSGILKAGLLEPKHVLWIGLVCFLLAVPIGIYFVIVSGWLLLPILLIGGIYILFYTSFITKLHLPEFGSALGTGTLQVLGFYFIQTGEYTLPVIVVSVASLILGFNILLLNEFPDAEADKIAGKKTLPIVIGKAKASRVYSVTAVLIYVWIIGGVVTGVMPVYTLIALLTVPLGIKAIQGALKYQDMARLVPAMASNVMVVLLAQLLLGVGFILGRVF